MFRQVETTLLNMMGHGLKAKLNGINSFLANVQRLGEPDSEKSHHAPQVIELSRIFKRDMANY